MAFMKSLGAERLTVDEQYDPRSLSSPHVFFYSMLIFLAIVGFVAAILYRQISTAFQSNPGLNGLILGVLAIGVLLALMQVIRLFREVRWVNSFLGRHGSNRAGSAGTHEAAPEPVLQHGPVHQLHAFDP